MTYQFIQPLVGNTFDIVGDIHGEIEALEKLLDVLGYDENGQHPEQRKLIFVGDLCDRGPNSIAVIDKVRTLVEQGCAQCVIGNHELNLLIDAKREGNGWFFGSPHEDDIQQFSSVAATAYDKIKILDFLVTLPVGLESDQLRIVHACWHSESIESLRSLAFTNLREAYEYFVAQTEQHLQNSGIAELAQKEQLQYKMQLKDPHASVPLLHHLAQKDLLEQMHNPLKVITSGSENFAEQPLYAGGKWRMIDRLAWWECYDEHIPVVVGHYWRNFKTSQQKHGLFKNIKPLAWFGKHNNVYCVDYSVGKRYIDRQQQREYSHQLGALRWPENTMIFEDRTILKTDRTT